MGIGGVEKRGGQDVKDVDVPQSRDPRTKDPWIGSSRYSLLTGVNVINVGKTYEKIVLAARILASIENPADVCVISARPYGHRAVLKYAGFTGANAIAGRLYVEWKFGSGRAGTVC